MNRTLILICLLAGSLHACTLAPVQPEPDTSGSGEISLARGLIGPGWPQLADDRLTTAGDIYLANLDSQIEALSAISTKRNEDLFLAPLALAYTHRFQVLGKLSDAEQARALLESASARPHTTVIDLAYARVLLGFHEFEQASSALMKAKQNGASQKDIARIHDAIQRATGSEPDPDITRMTNHVQENSVETLVTQAAELFERGLLAEASRRLRQAQNEYTDTAPFMLSWIHVQQGIMFLRNEDYASARIFFTAAHQRFPEYVLAAEHLAETHLAMGNISEAVALYTEVAGKTGNPEFYFRLAQAERAMGRNRQARHHETRAVIGYAERVSRYPQMFADHAARYYLDSGDTKTALALAQSNFTHRQDIRARTLLLEMALAGGETLIACWQLAEIQVRGYYPPELQLQSGRLALQCDSQAPGLIPRGAVSERIRLNLEQVP